MTAEYEVEQLYTELDFFSASNLEYTINMEYPLLGG